MLYGVRVPYCGYAYVEVEADTKDEAIEKALATDNLFDKIEEGNFHKQIIQGNCFYGELNEAEVEELENEIN